ncbi:glycerol uptake facilitator protein/aquaporin Z [Actinacidiphila yanglinensis]|uniref:Glycerol uptake facilitator protein/aquaporin Z n=1 Tax=Actinacidiphila yanglinensis TaxID=310779 RepID=A0A1H6EAJ2_9ACTN|nr:aquaporin [Actinacidiphila yanglinensis]SEG94139.1 glycerol uptake facilitator protein/aquaporin Z [Actinacidiphila yanglinensis]
MKKAPRHPPIPLRRAGDEFVLTAALLFVVVTAARWVFSPSSDLYVSDLYVAVPIVGVVSAVTLVLLILSPFGRRSGGHMNPGITVAVWLMDVFPGRSVLPYVTAQLAGSVTGTVLARLVWGGAVSSPAVDYGAIRPAPTWHPAAVFIAETGCLIGLTLVIGFFLAHPRRARLLPYTIGVAIALIIAFLGPRSGGSANPARQFGPNTIAGETVDLWIYLVAPILGACLGASVHHLLIRRFNTHKPLTYKLGGSGDGSAAGQPPHGH